MLPHTIILRLLRSRSMSLADLQQATQVSLPTLRKAVQELVDMRWIRIVGQAEVYSGRPPNMFGLDDTHYVLIGVHLQLPGMHLITTDITGRVLHEKRIIHGDMPMPDGVLKSISDYVLRVRQELPDRPLLGIGIATPGFLAPESGDILLIRRVPGWENFPIGSRLEMQFGVPTRIANDIDCMAFAEFQGGGISFERNLIYVGFDEGVKASLILNGELYKGALGNAGLIAGTLLNVDANGDLEDPQAVLSIHGVNDLFGRKVQALPEGHRSIYEAIGAIEDPRERFESMLRSAAAGLPVCRAVVQLMNQTLATAVANLIFIIQPDVFVIGGLLANMPADLFADLESRVRAFLPQLISHKVMIQLGRRTSPNHAALGATHYFLDHYLIDQEESQLLSYLSRP